MIEPGPLRRDKAQRDRLRHEEGGAHVEPHDDVEVFDRDVGQHLRPVGAGVVDQDVERLGLRDGAANRVDVSDVERQRLGLVAARTDRLGRGLDFGLGARRERHVRAGCGKRRPLQ